MRLKDKVAIVTGGGSGIGKAISLRFAAEGAAVVIAARNKARSGEVVKTIEAAGGRAIAVQADIGSHDQIKNLVSRVLEEFGQIDILVNNAAAMGQAPAAIVDMDIQPWMAAININMTGTMLMCKEVLKAMMPRRCGSIVNISSVGGMSGIPNQAPYSVTKRAVIALTEVLAIEAGQYDIRVNCICPGATHSQEWEENIHRMAKTKNMSFEELRGKIIDNNSLKRLAKPEEIANCALFLASDESSVVTGHNLVASCGFHIIHPREIK
jgi:3-oxoacyl-[acyl-carrier protein] reductase